MYVLRAGLSSLPLRTPVPRLAELLRPAATGLGAVPYYVHCALHAVRRAPSRRANVRPREGLGLGYVATLALQSKPSPIQLDH